MPEHTNNPGKPSTKRKPSTHSWIENSDDFGGSVRIDLLMPDWRYWPHFCARLLVQGRHAFLDRQKEVNQEPLTWEQFRDQLIEVGENYWLDIFNKLPTTGAGRPSDLRTRYWGHIRNALEQIRSKNNLTTGEDALPLVNGRAVSQGQLKRWIEKGDKQLNPQVQLVESSVRKYARWWQLAQKAYRAPYTLTNLDRDFLNRWDPFASHWVKMLFLASDRKPNAKELAKISMDICNTIARRERTSYDDLNV